MKEMKKQYKHPITEIVKLNVSEAVLDIPIVNNSTDVGDDGLAKENNLLFEDEGDFGDIWGEGDNSSNPYDLWGEN